jgi:hypothetical protein
METEKQKIIFKEMMKSIWFQLKHQNAFKNIFITHNAFGIFSINSHTNMHNNVGKPKVMYPTIKSANKAAEKMGEKLNCHFSVCEIPPLTLMFRSGGFSLLKKLGSLKGFC